MLPGYASTVESLHTLPASFPTWADAMVWQTHPRGEHKLMAIVQALESYLDESGTHQGSHWCIFGGYIGTTKRWAEFEDRWRRAFAPVHAYGVTSFHATEFFSYDSDGGRVGQYKDLSDSQRTALLDRLLEAIGRTDIHPAIRGIDVTAFNGYTLDERRMLTGGQFHGRRGAWTTSGKPSEALYLPFQDVLRECADRSNHPDRKVRIVCDQNHVQGGYMATLYQAIVKRETGRDPVAERLGGFQLEDKHVAIQLQAADMLVHCWYSYKLEGQRAHSEILYCMNVLAERVSTMLAFEKRNMDEILAQVPSGIRDGSLIKKTSTRFVGQRRG